MALRTALFLALLAALPFPATAWDEPGHEIVAKIAGALLTPKARAAVAESAQEISSPGHPYDPVSIACWMDDIRQDKEMPLHGKFASWHYIDIGIEPGDPTLSFVPADDNDVCGNAVQALKRAIVVLDGGTDPYIPNRAIACAIAMHLVGDIHQPLHCATHYFYSYGQWRNDAGGNKELVINGPPDDAQFNLHAFWDSAWRESFDQDSGDVVIDPSFGELYGHWNQGHHPQDIVPLANDLQAQATGPGKVDIDAWAQES